MTKTISEIYEEYKVMPNLREHMLRVASVASLICDNFAEDLPKEKIITACLLHDMANIIKADLSYFPEFNKPEGLEYWTKIKNDYIERYGNDEHKATVEILKELGIAEDIIELVDQIGFALIPSHRVSDSFPLKIVSYSDNRVTPHGIVSFEERIAEAKERYKSRINLPASKEGQDHIINSGKEMEGQIFSKCRIKPEDINDKSAESVISKLRDFVVKL